MDDKYRDLVSEQLFGRQMRLRVLAFVAAHPTGTTWQGQVSDAVGGNPTESGKELDRLVSIGLLQPPQRDSKASKKIYKRVDNHPLWAPLVTLLDTLDKAGP